MLKTTLLLVLGLLGLAVAARAQDPSVESEISVSGDYILQPMDLIQFRVFQEPDMDREVRISRETMVALPLIGQVSLKGKTIREAEAMIGDLLNRDYLVNPQINIVVLEYARRTVNVLGSVGSPGEIEFPREEGLTLLDAISRAGGFTRLADRRKVKLTRKDPDGTVENFIINTDDVIEGVTNEQWQLKTNDLIFVPERIL